MGLNQPIPEMLKDLQELCEKVFEESENPLRQDDDHPFFFDSVGCAHNRGLYLGRAAAATEVAKIASRINRIHPDAPPSIYGDGRYTGEDGCLKIHQEVTTTLTSLMASKTTLPWSFVSRAQKVGEEQGLSEFLTKATVVMNDSIFSFLREQERANTVQVESSHAEIAATFRSRLRGLLDSLAAR